MPTKIGKRSVESATADAARRSYLSQTDVPSLSLEQALRIPRALAEHYALKPTRPLGVAQALDLQPTTSNFRMLCGASIAYGLTEGGYNAPAISVTALGRRIVAPTSEGDDITAKREAALSRSLSNQHV